MTLVPTTMDPMFSAKCTPFDVNNDGTLDVFLTGGDTATGFEGGRLFANSPGTHTFSEVSVGFPQTYAAVSVVGDIDNDGWLDIFYSGEDDNGEPVSILYHNVGGTLQIGDTTIPAYKNGKGAFGDFDNDGDNDLLLAGPRWSTQLQSWVVAAAVYYNDNGTFAMSLDLDPRGFPQAKWLDYDGDGDLDAFVSGRNSGGMIVPPAIYEANNGALTLDPTAFLDSVQIDGITLADLGNDGDRDILLQGSSTFANLITTKAYGNGGGAFTAVIDTAIDQVRFGSVVSGDFDNSGNVDFASCGNNGSSDQAKLYIYSTGSSSFSEFPFPPSFNATTKYMSVLDYDNNGSLDFLGSYTGTQLFSNAPAATNTAPTAPTVSLISINDLDSSITIQWTGSTDTQTPTAGLSYSLWIGTTPNGMEITSPLADTATGWRRVVEYGQVVTTTWTLRNVQCGSDYYFRVQAVDGGYMGSEFSAPLHVDLNTPQIAIVSGGGSTGITNTVVAQVTGAYDTLQWYLNGNAIPGANSTTYELTNPTGAYTINAWNHFCKGSLDTTLVMIGILDPSSNASIQMWPNPAQTEVNLRIDNPGATESVAMYDMQGRLLREQHGAFGTQATLPVSDLTPGLYLIKLTLRDGRGIATGTFRKD